MSDSCMKAAEQTVLALRRAEVRTVAFAAPDPQSGNSTLAALVAAVLARSGQSTLLIDLSVAVPPTSGGPVWVPGQGDAKIATAAGEADFARLTVRADPQVRYLFANTEWFRSVLDVDLGSYEYVILDLAPLFDRQEDAVNPFAVAAACDVLILTCERGRTTRKRLRSSVDMALASGGHPFGIVMTQGRYVSPGEEIAGKVRRLLSFAPKLARWIGRKAMESEVLG